MKYLIRALIRMDDTGKTESFVFNLLDPFDMNDYLDYLEFDEVIEVFVSEHREDI